MWSKRVTILVEWILFCGFFSSTISACGIGWFGSSCQYKCHCTNNNCDDNGICTSGSTCVNGWFGPACQYVNLATSRTSNVTDNSDTTCIDDVNKQEVTISLKASTPFTWMRIVFKDPDQVPDFQLQFKSHDQDSVIDCKNLRKATVTKTSMDIHCDLDVAVDEVILKGDGVKSLCSVYISGGRNIALRQNTSQSSTYQSFTSKRAVDGNNNTFTHTNGIIDHHPNWNLIFTQPKLVNRYVLYNRHSCCKNRLKGFILQSFTQNGTIVFNYTDNKKSAKDVYNVLPTDVKQPISHVMIQATFKYSINPLKIVISLGEVEVFGESGCPNGNYGLDCDLKCNCDKKDETCFVSTGGCPSGCRSGFYGEDCQTECSSTYHGIDCKEKCNTNCLNELCNATTGVCMECKPGKRGDYCQTDCPSIKFGQMCNETCSDNCQDGSSMDRVCDSVNGTCLYGCKAGYLGLQCNETCYNETYGPDCSLKCSNSCNRNVTNWTSVCDHVNGQCLHGCSSYNQEEEDILCVTEASTSGGNNDDSIPLIAGVVVACVVLVLILAVGVVLWRKRRNPKTTREPDNESMLDFPVIDESNTTNDSSHLRESIKPHDAKSKGTEYYNMVKGLENTAIAVEDLHDFVMSRDKQFFEEQFYKIPTNSDMAMTVGLSDENNHKNRYKNVCAFDHSRVHLKINVSKKHGDYINASYIEGFRGQDIFIASQGPNKAMIEDFIRMLWEQKTEKVVMLTNLVEEGRQKCERYWPEKDEIQFGEIIVKLTTTEVYADYTIRRLQLSKAGQPVQNLTQFHFTSWPDKEVPTTPWGLVDFEQRVSLEPTDKPVVVHCSAGVGRTGTFIALCNVIREGQDTGRMDFFSTLHKLRQERVMMIQTLNQYIFLHKAAQVAMVCLETTVTSRDITERMKALESEAGEEGTKMNKEFEAISKLCREMKEEEKKTDIEEETNVYQNNPSNHLKNRFQDIVPDVTNRPYLMCENQETNGYINAVFVPSFTKQDQNLLTQLPLPTTISDFWQMITQYKVSLVVAFELDMKYKDKTIVDYLPSTEGEPITCPPFDIMTGPVTLGDCWEKQKLSVTKHGQKKHRLSLSHSQTEGHQLIHLKCPTTEFGPKSMLALMKEIKSNTPGGDGRTVFVCRNGAEYSGLVCVLSLLLDRMDHDQRLAVPLVVGTIKAIRPQVISNLSQYKFLYQVLQRYSQTQSSYSNMDQSSFKSKSTKGISNSAFEEDETDHVYANTKEEI